MSRRRRRDQGPVLDGVLVVDKPAGPTSHDVVQRVRRAAGQRRVGHTGTLDPAATGVLVVCLGRATRLVRFLQAGSKTYSARIRLGVATSTQDAQGEVLSEVDASHVDERRFCEALTHFQGSIQQTPPMVSAVKVGGERLHEKARRGESVEREARQVTVHALVLEDYVAGRHPEAAFLVTCSAGTYIRTLAHDVGELLGVGGHLTALRRVANGAFVLDDAHTLDAVEEAAAAGDLARLLVPPSQAVRRSLPCTPVSDEAVVRKLTQGGRLPAQGHEGPYGVLWEDQLVGIYTDHAEQGRPELVWMAPDAAPSAPSSQPKDSA